MFRIFRQRWSIGLLRVYVSNQMAAVRPGGGEPWVKFQPGATAMITGGNNIGRVGTIVDRERHPGSIEVVHVKDPRGQTFATRVSNVFVIGKGYSSYMLSS